MTLNHNSKSKAYCLGLHIPENTLRLLRNNSSRLLIKSHVSYPSNLLPITTRIGNLTLYTTFTTKGLTTILMTKLKGYIYVDTISDNNNNNHRVKYVDIDIDLNKRKTILNVQ